MKAENEQTDYITIEEEAMEQEVRTKLEIGHITPEFNLRTVDGRTIQPTDYKQRKNLLLFFFDVRSSDDWEMLAELKQRYDKIAENNAEVLAISAGPLEELQDCVDSMDLPFPILCDCDRETACKYCVVGPAIFVADKYGELKYVSDVSTYTIDDVLNRAMSVLELEEMECPECGVSTWPKYK